jgi:hypothetical protein
MKQTLTTYEVANLLWRDKENNGYTYEACHALAEHLAEMEDAMGEEMEVDVVAIRCDWNEYASLAEAYATHTGVDQPDFGDNDEDEKYKHTGYVARYFEERTSVVIFDVNKYEPEKKTQRVLIRQF